MRASVVIPALNEQQRIHAAIVSAWSAGADEVLVADGGSQDETLQAAHLATRVVQVERGRARQQNAAAAAATGDVLVFLHADCRLDTACLDQIRQTLPPTGLRWGAFRQRIDAPGLKYRLLEAGNAWRVRYLGLPYGDQGLFFQRDLFDRLGQFPETPFLEDLILARAARRLTWPALLPGPLWTSARRWQAQGVLHQTLRNWSITLAYLAGVPPERLARYYPRQDRSGR